MSAELTSEDRAHLTAAIELSRRARENGNHPFAALLVGPEGEVVMEMENGVVTGRNLTAHAECLLAQRASGEYDLSYLAKSTMYTSAEPCVMCAGAVYWSGIGRVVYGLSERALLPLTGAHDENPTMSLPCREVFARGQRHVDVVGPAMESEAGEPHKGFWH